MKSILAYNILKYKGLYLFRGFQLFAGNSHVPTLLISGSQVRTLSGSPLKIFLRDIFDFFRAVIFIQCDKDEITLGYLNFIIMAAPEDGDFYMQGDGC